VPEWLNEWVDDRTDHLIYRPLSTARDPAGSDWNRAAIVNPQLQLVYALLWIVDPSQAQEKMLEWDFEALKSLPACSTDTVFDLWDNLIKDGLLLDQRPDASVRRTGFGQVALRSREGISYAI
jgi:hypothetical protein